MLVKLSGTPYEQGKQQGQAVPEIIMHNLNSIKNSIKSSGVDESNYLKQMRDNYTFIEKNEPDMVEEMKGISEASGIGFDDILLINLPMYFMLKRMPQECSMILARGAATLDGKTYLAKNRDMRTDIRHVIVEREYTDHNRIIEVNGAGIITYPGNGVNKYGLAVATTGSWSKKIPIDFSMVGQSHTLLNTNLILKNCKTLDEAVEFLKESIRMNGMNFIIADKENAAVVEVTRDKVIVDKDRTGILARTNHYATEELSPLSPDFNEYTSTYRRYDRIISFLSEKHGNIRFQDMLEIISDHSNGPEDCICRHGHGKDATTIYSSIMVLEDFQVWTTLGNPCNALKLSYV
jgi:predicted choloylglycine hydrolase